jgi:hypothetical protein
VDEWGDTARGPLKRAQVVRVPSTDRPRAANTVVPEVLHVLIHSAMLWISAKKPEQRVLAPQHLRWDPRPFRGTVFCRECRGPGTEHSCRLNEPGVRMSDLFLAEAAERRNLG